MTKESLAALITGREIGDEVTPAESIEAKNARLVVVYGASDDLTEFSGFIDDERGAYDGNSHYLNADGLLDENHEDGPCNCKYCGFSATREKARKVEAVWDEKDGPKWTFKTDIPHATFEVFEDGEVWCRGIVFSMDDLGVQEVRNV